MSDVPSTGPPDDAPEPSDAQNDAPTTRGQLGYALSLPERALRSGAGLLGGAARESAALLVPRSFQSSRTYSVMVRQMLDFVVHDVGGVAQKPATTQVDKVDQYAARKAVGNFVDLASMATLHLSPVLLLAAVSDLAYGSQVYLKELAVELEQQGVIERASAVEHVNDLLAALSDTSAATSKVFDTPPLSADALRTTFDETRAAISRGGTGLKQLPSPAEIQRMWQDMRDISRREGVGMLTVSTVATLASLDKFATLGRGALSTVKVAGTLFDKHVLDHYATALDGIRRQGLYASLAATGGPYIAAVWHNFQPNRSTITEDLVSGKLLGRSWRAARKWLGREEPAAGDPSAPPDPQ